MAKCKAITVLYTIKYKENSARVLCTSLHIFSLSVTGRILFTRLAREFLKRQWGIMRYEIYKNEM